MWCIPEITDDFVVNMEDVLDIYALGYNFNEPVVCLDEKSLQLLKDYRNPIPMLKSGTIKKIDSEYIRCGTANIFVAVEPKGGRHITSVTSNRKGSEFAKFIYRIVKCYPGVDTIHLVMDNLNTHGIKSLIDYYGEDDGRKLWNKFTVHYTPKHASWLNQAEIEISLLSRQCLGKSRMGDIDILNKKVKAWNKAVNRNKTKIQWNFTTKKAREKFNY